MASELKPRGRPRARKLTDKQMAFCIWYVSAAVNMNGTEAARRAGYKGNANTLSTVAVENLLKPAIIAEVDKRMAKAMSGADVTVEYVLRRINILGEKALQLEQMSPAVRCAELLGKYLSMWTDKIEHVVDYEDMSTEDLVRLLKIVTEAGGVNLGELLAGDGSDDGRVLDLAADPTKH